MLGYHGHGSLQDITQMLFTPLTFYTANIAEICNKLKKKKIEQKGISTQKIPIVHSWDNAYTKAEIKNVFYI